MINILAILSPYEVEYGSPILQYEVNYIVIQSDCCFCHGMLWSHSQDCYGILGFHSQYGDLNVLAELEIETPDSRIA